MSSIWLLGIQSKNCKPHCPVRVLILFSRYLHFSSSLPSFSLPSFRPPFLPSSLLFLFLTEHPFSSFEFCIFPFLARPQGEKDLRRKIEMDARVEKGVVSYTEPVRKKLSNSWGWREMCQGVVRKCLPVKALVKHPTEKWDGDLTRTMAKGKREEAPKSRFAPALQPELLPPASAWKEEGVSPFLVLLHRKHC